jgi:hypothetical protein
MEVIATFVGGPLAGVRHSGEQAGFGDGSAQVAGQLFSYYLKSPPPDGRPCWFCATGDDGVPHFYKLTGQETATGLALNCEYAGSQPPAGYQGK